MATLWIKLEYDGDPNEGEHSMSGRKCGFILVDRTHANWPGLPRYRGKSSSTPYATREEAASRAKTIELWAAEHYGAAGGPDLRIQQACAPDRKRR